MDNNTDILIYQAEDGTTKIDVRLENETVWMTQKAIAELYQKNVRTINDHIINIYNEGELEESVTNRKNRIVQNKLHFAIHGHTAAELIAERVDSGKDNMGLTTWKGNKVRKTDITIAKNYLNEEEMKSLNRIVTMYLDYAEDQAERKKPMYMKDWEKKLNAFLEFNDREILSNAGKISKKVAEQLATEEYEKFNQKRLNNIIEDDFDIFIKENKFKGKR